MNKEVPNIISTKDLSYLSDMFTWTYLAYKNSVNTIDCINDADIKKMFTKVSKIFDANMQCILNMIEGGCNANKES